MKKNPREDRCSVMISLKKIVDSAVDEESALIYAHKAMRGKDDRIMDLEDMVADSKKQLEIEMAHSGYVNDLNVNLKSENAKLKDRLKIIVLPSALKNLMNVIHGHEQLIHSLRRAVVSALDLIPDTDENKGPKERLRKLYDQIA